MRNRIRRASKRTATIQPRTRRANRPVPYILTGTQTLSTTRCGDLVAVREILAGIAQAAIPTANDSDARHFEAADVVTMAIPRADINTIAAALLYIGKPNTLDLMNRLSGMRVRMKGAIQDRL